MKYLVGDTVWRDESKLTTCSEVHKPKANDLQGKARNQHALQNYPCQILINVRGIIR